MSEKITIVRQGKTYQIDKHKDRNTAIVYPMQGEIGPYQPEMPISTMHTEGSHQDRARGFNLRTRNLSIAAAFFSIPIAVLGWGVSLIGLPILGWMSGAYFSVWLISFIWDTAASPDGVALIRTIGDLNETRKNGNEQRRYFRSQYDE